MEFKLIEYHRNIPSDELIKDLQLASQKLNKKTISVSQYQEYGKYDYRIFKRRFGSWKNALIEAGLELHDEHNTKATDEELMKNLEEVWIKLGRQPSHSELTKDISKFSIRPYLRRFKTWMNALRYFVEYINSDVDNIDITDTKNIGHKTKREISLRLRFRVMQRDNFKCCICGRSPSTTPGLELHIDHIKPWSKGGETVIDNLQTLCIDCNLGKSNLE